MTSEEKVTLKDIYEVVARLEVKMDKRIEELEERFVTKEAFWPVKTIVYGGAGIIFIAVFGFLVNLAVKH